MKYRGLDPRTRRLRWAFFVLGVSLVVVASTPGVLDALGSWVTTEQARIPWYLTRILGVLAYAALSGSVIYGLLLSTGVLDAVAHRTVSFTLHQDLSAIGLGLALVHAALLTLDHSIPFTVLEVVVPFVAPYRPLWVGLGQVALGLTIVVIASFSVRRRIGQPRWRALHYLTFLVFLAATAHGLMAGSDTSAPWAFWGYLLTTASVAFLMGYRVVLAALGGRQARADRQPSSTARDLRASQTPVRRGGDAG